MVSHGENRGIAAARNSALAATTCDLLVFLDGDALAAPDYLARIIEPFVAEEVGGVNGRAEEVIQKTPYDRWRRDILFQHWGAAPKSSVFFLFGICAAYRTEALHRAGGFDERFRVSGEDMDMGFRLRRLGYRLAYAPSARVEHLRRDDETTIARMVFRHCYWGFLAQKKNSCYDNKVPLLVSAGMVARHLFIDGLARRQLRYAMLSLRLHLIIGRAWRLARATVINDSELLLPEIAGDDFGWEGHRSL